MTDTRIMPCEVCSGHGGWSVEVAFDPFTGRIGYGDFECPACLGSGEVEIDMEPIEEEDLFVSTLPSIPSSSDGGR